jgi:hypothetical protein
MGQRTNKYARAEHFGDPKVFNISSKVESQQHQK